MAGRDDIADMAGSRAVGGLLSLYSLLCGGWLSGLYVLDRKTVDLGREGVGKD